MSFEQPARQESGAGTVDWDAFFEHPPNGVIPLVSTAKSATALKQCSVLVVESLFTRDSDAPKRKAFLDILSTVIPPSGAESHIIETSKEQLVEIFQTIKDDRKARAQAYADEKAQDLTETNERRTLHTNYESADLDFDSDEDWNDVFGDTGTGGLDDDPLGAMDSSVSLTELDMSADMSADTTAEASPAPEPKSKGKTKGKADAPPPPDTSEMSLDDLIQEDDSDREFCEQFGVLMTERLASLRAEMTQDGIGSVCTPPPFLLSPDFADHFAKIVAAEIAPDVARQMPSINRNASMLPTAEERIAKINEGLHDPSNANAVWSAWQTAWKRRTQQQERPERPPQPFKAQKKKKGGLGLLGKLQGKKEKPDDSEAIWQKMLKQHRADNRKAKKIWEKITAESELYLPPQDEDNAFLMELFAFDFTALEKDVKALHQIVSQSSEAGRGFDTYRRSRHMDLPVLIVVFRYPDMFTKGVESKLKAMLRGYRKADLPKCMPLTARFLGDHLK